MNPNYLLRVVVTGKQPRDKGPEDKEHGDGVILPDA